MALYTYDVEEGGKNSLIFISFSCLHKSDVKITQIADIKLPPYCRRTLGRKAEYLQVGKGMILILSLGIKSRL